jgi:nanoRNase/pAp phosphatase (c-di-AMP/oligoRNAs hydrolase)
MATKLRAVPTQAEETVSASAEAPEDPTMYDELSLAILKEQQAEIRAKIKALKASGKPTGDKLERLCANQTEHPNAALVYVIQAYTKARVKAGQPADTAVAEVLVLCRAIAEGALVPATDQ